MKQSVHPAVLLGVVLGISIVWIDTSPGWNDSLGSVFLIIVAATG